jgi:hypothetical protein
MYGFEQIFGELLKPFFLEIMDLGVVLNVDDKFYSFIYNVYYTMLHVFFPEIVLSGIRFSATTNLFEEC